MLSLPQIEGLAPNWTILYSFSFSSSLYQSYIFRVFLTQSPFNFDWISGWTPVDSLHIVHPRMAWRADWVRSITTAVVSNTIIFPEMSNKENLYSDLSEAALPPTQTPTRMYTAGIKTAGKGSEWRFPVKILWVLSIDWNTGKGEASGIKKTFRANFT